MGRQQRRGCWRLSAARGGSGSEGSGMPSGVARWRGAIGGGEVNVRKGGHW